MKYEICICCFNVANYCSYVEQLVASAEAAVEEVVKRGVRLLDLCADINDFLQNVFASIC